MRIILYPLILLVFASVVLSGCYHDKYEVLYAAGPCTTDSATYTLKVKSILTQNCAISNCHDAASAMNGVNLSTVAGAQAVARDGRLLGTITHAQGYSQMPKNTNKLDDCSISQISKWVADGAPNN